MHVLTEELDRLLEEKKREKKRKEDLHALYVLELAEPWHEAAEGFKVQCSVARTLNP